MVIGSYGTGARPLVKPANDADGIWIIDESHLAIVDIHLYAEHRDPGSGSFIGPASAYGVRFTDSTSGASPENLLIENCKIEFFSNGVSIVGIAGSPLINFEIRRCIIADSYASPGSHCQGLFCNRVDGILIEENVLDHNGWYGDRDTGGVVGAPATQFNHNCYIDNTNPDEPTTRDNRPHIIIRGNITANASASGFQMRPGGTMENNVFILNCTNALLRPRNETWNPDGVDGIIRNNLVTEETVINSSNTAGKAIWIDNARSCAIEDNIVVNNINLNTFGIEISSGASHPCLDVSINRNIFYNWTRGAIRNVNPATGAIVEEEDNIYYEASSIPWPVTGTNRNAESLAFVDPGRTIASYNADQGGAANTAAFLAECRLQEKGNWRLNYLPTAIIQYFRDGLEVV